MPLKIEPLGVVTLDFKGGWKVRVEKNFEGGLGGVWLKFLHMEFDADSEMFGRVTISQDEDAADPLSPLQVVRQLPPTFSNTLQVSIKLTIEKPPGGGPPLVLAGKNLFTQLNDRLTVFPPQGAVYQLQHPVEFTPVGQPDEVRAQLLQFPATVSHNP
ncbi:hypothetical protein [Paraliomyxa miuraensis]|uniref:hypothetical protein n=1 Tax=Paraliomyxa miuraensis TaxID=376150 RepID=UPI00225B95B0|nr:hypothetical protein [Paraliomyxa miuraensis]MCX4239332.1 hypothetical protein [Paraliomyxa miuraensis]